MFLGLLYLPYFKTTINYQPGTIELPKGVHVDDVTVGFDNNNNQGNNTHQTDTTANLDSIIFNTQDKLEIEVPAESIQSINRFLFNGVTDSSQIKK